VILVLVAATLFSVRTARIADRQRERADRVTNFVVDVLTAANPTNRESGLETTGDVKLVDVMTAAGRRLATQFADDPGIQSELHAAIGRTQIGLGDYAAADAELSVALRNVGALAGQPAQQARVLDDAARLNHDEGRWEAAVKLEREAVDLFSHSPEARSNPGELSIMVNNLGVQLADSRQPAEAAAAFSRALDLAGTPPRHDDEIGAIHGNLGDIYVQLGRLGDAEKEARQAVEVLSRLPNPGLNLGYAEMKLGRIEYWRGHADAALADLEKATTDATRFAGPDHPYVVTIRIERDYQRAIAGRATDAEADLEKCLALARRSEGGISLPRALAALGYVRALAGHAHEGEPLLRDALSQLERNNFPFPIARTEAELAECLAREGKAEEAREHYMKARQGFEKIFGPGEWLPRETARKLAQIAAVAGR
jgi:tetratricopeptide (TPR) repeat protein